MKPLHQRAALSAGNPNAVTNLASKKKHLLKPCSLLCWCCLVALLICANAYGTEIFVTTNYFYIQGEWFDPVTGMSDTVQRSGNDPPGLSASSGSDLIGFSGYVDSFNMALSAVANGAWANDQPPTSFMWAFGITQFTFDGSVSPYLKIAVEGEIGWLANFNYSLRDVTTGEYLLEENSWLGESTVMADPSHEFAFRLEGSLSAAAWPAGAGYTALQTHASITTVPECHTGSILAFYMCGLAAFLKVNRSRVELT